MSQREAQPTVASLGALLAGAAITAAASAVAAGASAALSRLPKLRLSTQAWQALFDEEGRVVDAGRLFNLAQQGVDPSLRPSAWPFLLRVFPADSTDAERQVLLAEMGVAFDSLLDQAKVASSASPAAGSSDTGGSSDGNGGNVEANSSSSSSAGSSSSGEGASNTGNDSRDASAELQRCIIMDVMRTNLSASHASGLTRDCGAAVSAPETDAAAAPDVECISPAAQQALNEAEHLTPAARHQAARLFNVLCAHAVHDPHTGYAQGMSDLAAILMLVFPDSDVLAFWCFQRMMEAAREGFRHDECGIRRQLRQLSVLLSRADPVLHQRLKALRCADCMFAYRMLVVLLLRDLPVAEAVRLWECGWADQRQLEAQKAGAAAAAAAAQDDRAAGSAPSLLLAPPSSPPTNLLLAFVLAVICGERRHVLQHCAAADDVICHFAMINISFDGTLREARHLQQRL